MTIAENEKNVEKTEVQQEANSTTKDKFTTLVFFACLLSLGSLAYTTWSFLDLNKIDAMKIQKFGNLSLIGLSAAAAMDIFWTATMVAEYRGRKVMARFGRKLGRDAQGSPTGPRERINILPHIGWIEVAAIALMLGYHGQDKGGWAAAFTAVLPIATKFVWMLALDDIRDPDELTEEEKAEVAGDRRAARLAKEKSDASILKHEADMEALRRKNAAELEEARATAQKKKINLQSQFELEKAEEEGKAEVAIMRNRLKSTISIERLRSDNEIDMQILEVQRDHRIASVGGIGRTIQGETVSRPQLPRGGGEEQDAPEISDTGKGALANLSGPQRRKADLAARYYEADYVEGSITKAAFAKANDIGAPRVTEATGLFPAEWFIENDLAYWIK